MISYQRKIELTSLGYYVEDMQAEWGDEFVGEYRWMNNQTEEFQDWGTSSSIEDAWIEADLFAQGV